MKQQPVYGQHREIFDAVRGAGFWAWKPIIILNVMYMHNPDDLILYLDASTYLKENPMQVILDNAPEVITAVQTGFPCWQWTKRDCFVNMGCDSAEYWSADQVWAGVVIVRVCDEAKRFVAEWQKYCLDYHTIGNKPSEHENFKGFIAHREDQSILSNLIIKHKIKTFTTQIFQDR